jgi:hypothetical protein
MGGFPLVATFSERVAEVRVSPKSLKFFNRIPVMVPLTAPLFNGTTFGVTCFKGASLPQKLTPKADIETQ